MQTAENFALEEWIELSNGCLCCSVKTEMVAALETLMQKRHRFDYILLETTGKEEAPLNAAAAAAAAALMLVSLQGCMHSKPACIAIALLGPELLI